MMRCSSERGSEGVQTAGWVTIHAFRPHHGSLKISVMIELDWKTYYAEN